MDFEEYVKTKYPYFFDHEGSLLIPDDNSYEKPFSLSDLIDCWNASAEAHKPRWIPVSERLPDREGYYPVKINNELSSFYKGYFDESKKMFDKVYFIKQFNKVTHWLELPEMPE